MRYEVGLGSMELDNGRMIGIILIILLYDLGSYIDIEQRNSSKYRAESILEDDCVVRH